MRVLVVALVSLVLLLAGAVRAAQPDAQLKVRHVYDGCGTLCYLGALAMALPGEGVPYKKLVRYTNPALFDNGEVILGQGLKNLGYSLKVVGANPIRTQEYIKMMVPSALAGPSLPDQKAAVAHLEGLLRSGVAPMVPVEQGALWEDRVAFLRRLKAPLPPNPGNGPHYLVITGFDSKYFYANDPARKSAREGTNVPLRRAAFLKAWGADGSVMMVPSKVGPPVAEEVVLQQVMEAARGSVRELEMEQQRLAKEAGSLNLAAFLNLSAGAYRRQALADWLNEKGYKDSAAIYKAASRYYERIRPDLSNKQASGIVARIHALEKDAVSRLPSSQSAPPRS